MENEGTTVELANEPAIESRFGFQKENRVLSSNVIRIGMVGTGLTLIGILLTKSPDRPDPAHGEIKSPNAAQVSQGQQKINLDSYSVTEENQRIKEKNKSKKRAATMVVRLPGLQKIDRRTASQIPPGSLVKAVLVTGASNGPVRAQLTESLQIQGETLIPEGAALLGSGQSTEERLFVKFTKLVLQDGTVSNISAQAADSGDKTAGLKGSRVGRYATKYAAAIGLDFIGGMASGLQDQQVVGPFGVTTPPTVKNALLNGTSRATVDMANETLTDIRNKPPVIAVDAGKEILVIFDGSSN
ncbi:MAG: hypothetical protein C5B49_08865 [Bdellovibrio sp.]|nr:MAG: hypothetical protein C5B49_08865 [Bdellovibrio sp.]